MPTIVLGTSNPHKVEELRAIFASAGLHGVTLQGLKDVPGVTTREPEETGETFEANARVKAISYAAQTGCICLADDSGLEIDALHGKPGVISSHYCTDGREVGMSRPERDAANNQRVLRELRDVPMERRAARFVCVMALATPSGELLAQTRGTFEGRIGLPGPPPAGVPRGDHGFGYDPLFLLPAPDERSSAELSNDEKNQRSHRGAAARAMAERLNAIRERLGLVSG